MYLRPLSHAILTAFGGLKEVIGSVLIHMRPGVTREMPWQSAKSFKFTSLFYLSCVLRVPWERNHGSIDSETVKYFSCPVGSCDSFILSICWLALVRRYLNHSSLQSCATITLPEESAIISISFTIWKYHVWCVLSFGFLNLLTLLWWVCGMFQADRPNELVLKVAAHNHFFPCLNPNTSFSFCANKTKPTVRNIQFTPSYPLHCMLHRADRGASKPCYDIIARLWGISFHFIPWLMMPPADYIKKNQKAHVPA